MLPLSLGYSASPQTEPVTVPAAGALAPLLSTPSCSDPGPGSGPSAQAGAQQSIAPGPRRADGATRPSHTA